jgi:hypothetical protein
MKRCCVENGKGEKTQPYVLMSPSKLRLDCGFGIDSLPPRVAFIFIVLRLVSLFEIQSERNAASLSLAQLQPRTLKTTYLTKCFVLPSRLFIGIYQERLKYSLLGQLHAEDFRQKLQQLLIFGSLSAIEFGLW